MKKIFPCLALVAGTFVFAQKTSTNTTSSSPIRFGLKAGINISSLSDSEFSSKTGFYGGAFANIPVAKDFSVQPEVLYSGMGAKHLSTDSKVNLDYISIPVMLQYNTLPNLYLEAGPQFNFLVSSKVKFPSSSIDGKDIFKTFDFGLGLGAGYYFTPNIGVNVRYVAGLTNIGKDRPGYTSSTKSDVFQIGLAYKF